MGKVTGFLEIPRRDRGYQPVDERIRHWDEFVIPLSDEELKQQAARCMDCGIPYCHNGCPINNQIPDWNDLTYRGDWKTAIENLHTTNNFPDITGRVCPAPCEAACTLYLEDIPVTIKTVECQLADHAWEQGWIVPKPPAKKTGKRVAIVGSGPAGLAAAQQLARVGHEVHVYEKNKYPGGLLRYGIPDFKLNKKIVERRVQQMEKEGVTFHTGVHVGVDLSIKSLLDEFDAVLMAGGSEKPRDLPIPGRDLHGIHFAMEFLTQANRRVSGEGLREGEEPITAEGKHVLVIGGGDTGSDCVGTSIRQGALSVTQVEILPKPPEREDKLLTWPNWPRKLRISTSQEEGAELMWSVRTEEFLGDEEGRVRAARMVKVDEKLQPIEGTDFELKADLVLLAMGFVHPVHEGMIEELGDALELDERGNVKADEITYQTSVPKLYVAGDMRRGQSLVVWAIREGRRAAAAIDEALMGETLLPR
ncbi:glutamate synthase subunit beta [Thermopetrobacter sp. TC1]|uniref:glutamate synthase subunit beta n=1 Tax=Thermopetrobacter sp. TC1 TaxID=1495045 RepID=UPI00056FB6C8|nr:glutamate synthase subunit beta [Thermopetrobacter sp. TC1]